MNQGGKKIIRELIYPELSYKIMSIIFEVHNKVGNKWREIDFCNAIEIALKRDKINYEREKRISLKFEGSEFAKCRLDFIIENKIILEVKKVWRLGDSEIKQALRYLDASGFKLAIIVNIRHNRVQSIRVVNPKVNQQE